MGFKIPNAADAADPNQAEPDSVDFDVFVAAHLGYGIVSGCAVTAQGSPNMTVAVAAGGIYAPTPTVVPVAGGNVTITTADATNPRFDLIVADTADGSLSAIAGTPAADPVFPAFSDVGDVVLAAVYVPANDTTIGSTQITDKRVTLPTPNRVVLRGLPTGTLDRAYAFTGSTESWTTSTGTLSEESDRLQIIAAATNTILLEPSGASAVADGEVTVDVTYVSGTTNIGIIFRATDASNLYMVNINGGSSAQPYQVELYKQVSGSFSSLGLGAAAILVGTPGFKAMVRFVGSLIELYINDAWVASWTDATFSTGIVGAYAYDGTYQFDNVRVYDGVDLVTGNIIAA